MEKSKREKSSRYPGVYYRIESDGKGRTFYIVYRRGGRGSKLIEEPVGKTSGGMTEAKAAQIRADRIRGKELSNTEQREAAVAAQRAEQGRWTIDKIWQAYQEAHPEHKGRDRDISRYNTHIGPRFGSKTPEELVTADIDAYKVDALKAGKSRGTIQRVISQMRAIINFGVKRGFCPPLHPGRLTRTHFIINGQFL